jgi:eukaryotic-like serine/threonine-protein kinase
MTQPRKQSWKARRGSELVPGRHVIDRLGGGRRTEVYRCTDDATGEPVVVKVLRPGRNDPRDVRMLRREARTLAALDHPSFPHLLDSDLDADPAWIVMSQADGPALSTLVRDHGLLEVEQARPLAHDVADALAHLHERGRVHLDVKPSNILMGARPMLLDLGASRTIERAAALSAGVGTVAWLSPEQADPDRFGPPGPPADVWGLGMVLLYATTGTNPLEARRDDDPPGEDDLARACLEAASQVPASLRDLVQACLATGATDRPTAAEVRDRTRAVTTSGGSLRRISTFFRGPRPSEDV